MTQWPNVPTFTEVGMPTLVGNYFILSTPAGVARPITDKIYTAGQRALQTAEMKSALDKLKFDAVPISAEVTAKTLAEQSKLYADLGKAAGIQPE